jgi:hypothetical protein
MPMQSMGMLSTKAQWVFGIHNLIIPMHFLTVVTIADTIATGNCGTFVILICIYF